MGNHFQFGSMPTLLPSELDHQKLKSAAFALCAAVVPLEICCAAAEPEPDESPPEAPPKRLGYYIMPVDIIPVEHAPPDMALKANEKPQN